MKLYLLAFCLIFNLSLSVFSQTADPILTGNETPKELKKLEERKRKEEEKLAKEKAKKAKQAEKDAKKANEIRLQNATIQLDSLMNFPQKYVGQQLRVTRVVIGNANRFQQGSDIVYLLDLRSSSVRESGEYYPGVFSPRYVNFFVTESYAQELFAHYQDQRQRNISRDNEGVGNIVFTATAFTPQPGGATFYFARAVH